MSGDNLEEARVDWRHLTIPFPVDAPHGDDVEMIPSEMWRRYRDALTRFLDLRDRVTNAMDAAKVTPDRLA